MLSDPVSYETFLLHLCSDNLQPWLLSMSRLEAAAAAQDLLTKQSTCAWHRSHWQCMLGLMLWRPWFGQGSLWTLQHGPAFPLSDHVVFYPQNTKALVFVCKVCELNLLMLICRWCHICPLPISSLLEKNSGIDKIRIKKCLLLQ